ncbi:MAG: NUDIX hydrolase [Planctomycetes bacterium]|jgi:ADP-ribose pyrophosphatase YjhB (NUDIX family)|nr:NUDIX hydrolase [Planctomycetota bacterium]
MRKSGKQTKAIVYPKLVTVAVINQIDKVLLIQRAQEPSSGKWALPSGTDGFRKFSNPEDVVKEEVRSDLGVEFTVDYFLKYYYSELGDEPVVILVFSGKIDSQPAPNPEAVLEWRYFSEEEVAGLDLAFEHKKILRDFFYQ